MYVVDDICCNQPKSWTFYIKRFLFCLWLLALVFAYHKTWAMLSQFGKPLNFCFVFNFKTKSERKRVNSFQLSSFISKALINFVVVVVFDLFYLLLLLLLVILLLLFIFLLLLLFYYFFSLKEIYCILENPSQWVHKMIK